MECRAGQVHLKLKPDPAHTQNPLLTDPSCCKAGSKPDLTRLGRGRYSQIELNLPPLYATRLFIGVYLKSHVIWMYILVCPWRIVIYI